ncbi:MAG: CpaF family protein [Acidimicrobiia bacterium]|nr:CpaF family protein [Acidimicrobiia bacterium]
MVNAPDLIFVRRHRGPSGYHPDVFHDEDHVVRTVTRLLDRAAGSHRVLDPSEGIQDAQLENGARVHIVHGDLSRGGHLLVNIRKFTGVAYRSLDELVDAGTLSSAAAHLLRCAVTAGATIVFSGAPGSGKTTLLSCCTAELPPGRRVVTAEEVFEVEIPVPNVAAMQTRPRRPDRASVDLRRLVGAFLRMAPDVAIVGEVRDREALPLLLTLSSGVTGYTTIHAGTARQALTRLRFICQLSGAGEHLPVHALNSLITDTVDIVVHSVRSASGPQVSEIIAVDDLVASPDAAQFTTTTIFERTTSSGELEWTGHRPARLHSRMLRAGLTSPFDAAADRTAGGRSSYTDERRGIPGTEVDTPQADPTARRTTDPTPSPPDPTTPPPRRRLW